MSNPGLTDEQIEEAAEAYKKAGGVQQAAADMLGLHVSTFKNRLRAAAKRGLIGTDSVLPGFIIHRTTEWQDDDGTVTKRVVQQRPEREAPETIPDGFRLKRVSQYTDAHGNFAGGWKIAEVGKPDPSAFAKLIREELADFKPDIPTIPAPANTDDSTLATYILADWHVGISTREWGLDEASSVLTDTFAELVAAQHPSKRALIIGGGDFTHNDNIAGLTPRSGNPTNPAGTWKEVFKTSREVASSVCSLALQRHEQVDLMFLPGNHDETTAHGVSAFLEGLFHNEPRFNVLNEDDGFFHYVFGKVMLFGHHGHDLKLPDFAPRMAGLYPEAWGKTEHRYAHGFHLHHKQKLMHEGNGAIAEIHQSPAPKDEWSRSKGFVSGRSIQSILYHEQDGEWFRVTRPIREWRKAA